MCLAFAIAALFKDGAAALTGAGAMVLAGMLGATLILISWRYYQPYWSRLIWAVPAPAILVIAFESTLAPLVMTGAISVLGGIWAAGGFGGLGLFGSLFLFRRFVERRLDGQEH